jgi:hypothetical protein
MTAEIVIVINGFYVNLRKTFHIMRDWVPIVRFKLRLKLRTTEHNTVKLTPFLLLYYYVLINYNNKVLIIRQQFKMLDFILLPLYRAARTLN